MKTVLIALALGFVLSPNTLLRRNAAWLAGNAPSKAELSAKLLPTGVVELPPGLKAEGNNLGAKWSIDTQAQSCGLHVPSAEGAWEFVWKNGLVVKTREGWPAVEAMLLGSCGVWVAHASEARGALEKFLSSLKINMRASRLELMEREVVYALGEAGARTPQYWIGKDDFSVRGLRWLDAEGVLWELRYKKGDSFPYALEVWREGQMALRVLTAAAKR
ncbi:MAG: hypothetical protein FWG75_10615 [Cystobacterineae bacterium]|nr:hypothetical protein [Cystobacterineae bacterium]